ncbi:hypothetical protein KY495_01765 [Massilia sp. PAMC28688]|uniref:hypothetical protein n=1 Tax=Massilia sp. PAMC28688 TaxID=2861283 RepID=UPI001C624E8A|nr:hypothetical protein [Massilia sp. PAMC28688]QYF93994.1 hypothetical protein KY495_01765 [Massilia sp. PAMC28688]
MASSADRYEIKTKMMRRYDEPSLVLALTELEAGCLVAFATAAATRQLSVYEYFMKDASGGYSLRLRAIASSLWTILGTRPVDAAYWSAILDEVMSMIPDEGTAPLADDGVSSLAYSIRCLLNRDPQEAAWAARRAYEAADQAAIWDLDIQVGLPETEAALQAHVFVQRELTHQALDLQLLGRGLIDEVKTRAYHNTLLSTAELKSL